MRKIYPSSRTKHDPARMSEDCEHKNLYPIPINGMSLIRPVLKQIISHRHEPLNPVRDNTKKLSVIIPFRDRDAHLKEFAPVLIAQLNKQEIPFEILVIEQEFGKPFNGGLLKNIGALEANKDSEMLCFHDVDHVPLETADYRHCTLPVRLIDKALLDVGDNRQSSKRMGPHYFGGVIMCPKEMFEKVNGYENDYWHWGFEDNDLLLRFLLVGISPLYDTGGEFRSLYHQRSMHKTADGIYSEDLAIRKKLQKFIKKNGVKFSRFRRGISGNGKDLLRCNYDVLERKELYGCKLIKVSI